MIATLHAYFECIQRLRLFAQKRLDEAKAVKFLSSKKNKRIMLIYTEHVTQLKENIMER